MRLRKKSWVTEAIKEYNDIVFVNPDMNHKGRWKEGFGRDAALYVELGTGKGRFIAEMAARNPDVDFIGIEAQQDVLFYAAQKVREKALTNVRLLVFNINNILDIFSPNEVTRFYVNFCDPWPKNRHDKRRLTHKNFLDKYREILKKDGELFLKTDNEQLFEFSLNQFADSNLKLANITFDLHNSGYEGNVQTEYEEKFSAKGMKIYRCEAYFR